MNSSFEKTVVFISTGAYTGRVPFAPGTFGTLAGIPFIIIAWLLPESFTGIFTTLFIIASVYFADRASKILNDKDPKEVVIDEVAGYMVALSGITLSFSSLVAGFALFRFFDILKPWPVNAAEKKFTGGTGIVFDDLIAGVYANLILRLFF